jgi:predicted Zn-dependent protease
MSIALRPLASLLLLTVACVPIPGTQGSIGTITAQIGSPVKASWQGGIFRTQAFDVDDVYKANVSVTGPGIAAPVNATSNPIAMPNGQGATSVQIIVPTGNNRIITAQGLDAASGALPSWITVKGVTNVGPGINAAVPVNWATTPTARVIEALITAASPHAATVDANAIQTLVNQITVPSGAAPNTTYAVHPSLVNATAIANAIIAGSGTVPGAPQAGFTMAAGSITGTISGLMVVNPTKYFTATVVANDPASSPVTTAPNGSYTITGVTPGTGITVKATSDFTEDGKTTTNVPTGGAGGANIGLTGLHYISNSLYGGNKVLRFDRTPIEVLIVRPSNPAAIGWTADHETAFIEALNRWSSQLNDVIVFNRQPPTTDADPALAGRKADADIWVEWLHDFGSTTLGLCTTTVQGSLLKEVKIQLATHSQTALLPNFTYRSVALHEMGHALGSTGSGSQGHSDLDSDLMYASTDPEFPFNLIPTARDFKNMRLLYTLPADITRP